MALNFKKSGTVTKKLFHTIHFSAEDIANLVRDYLIEHGVNIPEGEEFLLFRESHESFDDLLELKEEARANSIDAVFVVYEEDEEDIEENE